MKIKRLVCAVRGHLVNGGQLVWASPPALDMTQCRCCGRWVKKQYKTTWALVSREELVAAALMHDDFPKNAPEEAPPAKNKEDGVFGFFRTMEWPGLVIFVILFSAMLFCFGTSLWGLLKILGVL